MVDFHGHVSLTARVVHVDKISDIGSPSVAEKNPDFINWQLKRLFVGRYIYTYTCRLYIHIHTDCIYIYIHIHTDCIYIHTYTDRLYVCMYIYIHVILCVL